MFPFSTVLHPECMFNSHKLSARPPCGTVFTGGIHGNLIAWLERRTRDRKVASSKQAGAAGEFSSPESALCAYSYSVSVPPPCYRSRT